ncbi:MAG: SAM-dependent chlorinase/fluorinase [Nitrososphaerota archaeon]|nr:SAM-dependent chlorinase/fluorinase [Nitrososphaerota archaeon]
MTDFGLKDQYVFQMKSVIKRISPSTDIIDITHNIPKFDIHTGAFVLKQAVRYLPESAIVVGVVDPGVGSRRRCIAIRAKGLFFVGPDNGLMFEAVRACGDFEVREIKSNEVVLKRGGTFDGRDVFAPTAAHLAEGYPFAKLGPAIKNMVSYRFPRPHIAAGLVIAHILHIDDFGNAILDLTDEEFYDWSKGQLRFEVQVGGIKFESGFSKSYIGLVDRGFVVGSSGLLELSTNRRGPASPLIKTGDVVKIRRLNT